MSLMGKTSYDTDMPKEKPELSDAMRKKIQGKTFEKNPIKGTKFTIAISSAKGGVGKSTFATNLALALKTIGCKVGLLDADIYGPSIPKMLGINEKPKSDGQKLDPVVKYGIQCMSIGFLTDQQTPMIWRGPMVTSAIRTFTQKVSWVSPVPGGISTIIKSKSFQLTFCVKVLIALVTIGPRQIIGVC